VSGRSGSIQPATNAKYYHRYIFQVSVGSLPFCVESQALRYHVAVSDTTYTDLQQMTIDTLGHK
jgi:hypothetical protein